MEKHNRLTFLERQLDPAFEKRTVGVAPADQRVYDEAEWQDALVVIERGEIELESTAGGRQCFARGDVICLAGLPLRAVRNRGEEPAVLVVVSRRHPLTD